MVEPTIAEVVRAHARRHAGREALVFEGRRWTWGKLRVRASRVANALRGRRLEPSDRVAVLSRNVSELWELFLGCALSGTVLCPINFRLVPEHDTVRGLVGYTGARLVFVGAEYEEFAREALASLPLGAADVIALDRDFEAFLLGASDRPPEVTVAAEDPVAMLHTSGTTGDPKGAVISHGAWIWNGLTELTHPRRAARERSGTPGHAPGSHRGTHLAGPRPPSSAVPRWCSAGTGIPTSSSS